MNVLPLVQWIPGFPDSKKVEFPYRGLNAGSSFISQDKGMSESSVQTLEKALGPNLIWTGASHPLPPRETHGVQCFKGAEA